MASKLTNESLNEQDSPMSSNHTIPVEDYADAKLIQEMMDMDVETFKQLGKQKKAEDREMRKEDERGVDKEENREGEEENKKGEASKLDKDIECDEEDHKKEELETFKRLTDPIRRKMEKLEVDDEEIGIAFKRYLITRVLKNEIEKEKVDCELLRLEDGADIRDCFGRPDSCNNCESKGCTEKPACASVETFKRCSGCHLVAYCSERCQKEHWINNHKKMCKVLSGKKKIGIQRHSTESCEECNSNIDFILKEKNSKLMPCGLDKMQVYIVNHYWLHFGYHTQAFCKCSSETKRLRMRTMEFPMQPPFTMGEISGKYLGWIDQYLAVLAAYLVAIEEKYDKEIESLSIKSSITNIAMFIAGNRASYWYYVTNEKSRAMTEVLFTQRIEKISSMCTNHLQEIDKGFQVLEEKNVWWETFLHHLGQFYRRLRRTKYLLFNTQSILEHKMEEFDFFRDLNEDAIMFLSSSVEELLPMKTFANIQGLDPGFFVILSSETKCYVCGVDIGGKAAQWQLQIPVDQNIWVVDESKTLEEIMLIRYPKIPIIFENKGKKGLMVTCGVNTNCNAKALKDQLNCYIMGTKTNLNFLFHSQKCQGCLRFAHESHRCSGCRSVRYCSQDCLVDDWKVHQTNCKDSSENSTQDKSSEKDIGRRKLEGESKTAYYDQCADWLGKSDTIVKLVLFSWKMKNIRLDQLFNSESSKKRKKKKDSKCASNRKVEVISSEDDISAKEIIPNKKESTPPEEKSGPKVTLISCGSFLTQSMSLKLASMFENDGVKVSVLSMNDNGTSIDIKPFITEDEDGKQTVHKENIPENQRIKNTAEPEKIKTEECLVKPEDLTKLETLVQQHRSITMLQKHFEIRHIKNQAWLNEKVCQVVDVELKNDDLFDPRVVCKLKDEDKQFSLKQTNLVDICTNIEDIIETRCCADHSFKKATENLEDSFVTNVLKKLFAWAAASNQTRHDQVYRLAQLRKYISGEVKEIPCKDNPDYEEFGTNHQQSNLAENEVFSACLAAIRPGCVGDNLVHFNRFNQLTCECAEQIVKRFREFVITGMCHACQAFYIERKNVDNLEPFGNLFVKCSRVNSLDGLTLGTA